MWSVRVVAGQQAGAGDERSRGVMKCERYARGLPYWWLVVGTNFPTFRLVDLLGSRRVGGVRQGGYRRGKARKDGERGGHGRKGGSRHGLVVRAAGGGGLAALRGGGSPAATGGWWVVAEARR